MPPECMELRARRFEIKEGFSGSKAGSLAFFLWLSLPQGCLDDCAADPCVSQWRVFQMGGLAEGAGLSFFGCSRGEKL